MTFQVREFEFQADSQQFNWKFKLGNINTSQLDFYSQDPTSRSLLDLGQDLTAQIQQVIDKKNKKSEGKERTIRKLCEKMLKGLKVNLSSFAEDIKEEKQVVVRYFRKEELGETVLERIGEKCRKWIISTWLSLTPQDFYQITHKYLDSFFKDGKKINPDFEILNEIYLITIGDDFTVEEEQENINRSELVLIDINLTIEEKYISKNFLWDPENISLIKVKSFVTHFLNDILAENDIAIEKEAFKQLQKDCRVQLRTQILYKMLLKKYSNILLNFSTVDIPAEVKEYLITINLKLSNDDNSIFYEDSFEWDILNEQNNVEQFVESIIEDGEIPYKYFSQICYKIRSQINSQLEWKFGLMVKTFKAIHKDRESPKLNTQTISVLRKNITYTMDVTLPFSNSKYQLNSNIFFNNSDLFSLLSRNIDILPEEFQDILMYKELKNIQKETAKITHTQADEILHKSKLSIQTNPYLNNLNCNFNSLQNIWKERVSTQQK